MNQVIKCCLALILPACIACTQKKQVSKTNSRIEEFLQKDVSKLMVSDSFRVLLPLLDSIILADQKYRSAYSNEIYLSTLKEQTKLDSVNIIKIKTITDRCGWPGPRQIGIRSTYLFYAVQHCNITDREYFLPILLDAYCNKKLPSTSMFSFIDRLLTQQHEQQLFGTQVFQAKGKKADGVQNLYPVYAPHNIEERWKKYKSLSNYPDYIKHAYHIIWDADECLKYVPANAKVLKINLDSTGNITRMLHLLDSCRMLMDKK